MAFQALVFTVVFFLLALLNPAFGELPSCTASDKSCEMYSCVEQHFQCGKKNYLTRYGFKNCEKYRKVQDSSSKKLKKWYPKVRYCLQTKLAEIAEQTFNTETGCEDLERMAFDSHVDCYLETGFCDLNFLDKLAVATVAGFALLNPESVKAEEAVTAACAKMLK